VLIPLTTQTIAALVVGVVFRVKPAKQEHVRIPFVPLAMNLKMDHAK
jgi:hypothetical protein